MHKLDFYLILDSAPGHTSFTSFLHLAFWLILLQKVSGSPQLAEKRE